MTDPIPVHQFTHDGDKILFLRCCERDGTSHEGFQWPDVGEIAEPEKWDPEPECGNGLHGWPWGTSFGDGKAPQYNGLWIVFAATPEDVVDLGGKCKVRRAEVVYRGDYQTALSKILPGYHAWVLQASSGASSATGYRGASSATGDSGASSATGDRGASSATGYRGASSATGDRGASSATGDSGASSATGDSGASSATGYRGASSATGYSGVAAITGECGTIEVGANSFGIVTSDRWYWRVHDGAFVVCRVRSEPPRVFDASDYADGELIAVEFGQVVEAFDWDKEYSEPTGENA